MPFTRTCDQKTSSKRRSGHCSAAGRWHRWSPDSNRKGGAAMLHDLQDPKRQILAQVRLYDTLLRETAGKGSPGSKRGFNQQTCCSKGPNSSAETRSKLATKMRHMHRSYSYSVSTSHRAKATCWKFALPRSEWPSLQEVLGNFIMHLATLSCALDYFYRAHLATLCSVLGYFLLST